MFRHKFVILIVMIQKIGGKLSFLFLFLLDLYFVVWGLRYIKTPGETLYAFLFFVLVWLAVWSVIKTRTYFDENRAESFWRYYFSYFIKGSKAVTNEV